MKIFRSLFAANKSGIILLSSLFAVSIAPAQNSALVLPANIYPTVAAFAIGPVRIINPANHTFFRAPVDIPILASVRSGIRFVDPSTGQAIVSIYTNVEYFANGIDLGPGKRLLTPAPPTVSGSPVNILPQYYSLTWSNVPPGAYSLVAVAQSPDLVPAGTVGSRSATSPPVNITVLIHGISPTNRPDVVSVVATDPVAIEGTNCWVWAGSTNATPAWTNWPPARWTFFTNCGPDSATFTVRRVGDVTDALTIPYKLSGTASNGVDYLALPGSVTIPAGEADAAINVVPIDDSTANINKTVIITLTASTSVAPDYVLGLPVRAAAVIFDRHPRFLPLVLSDRSFHLNANGPDGAWFAIESSTDLLHWMPVCTNQVVQGSIDFVDPNAPNNFNGFYRAVPQPDPAP